MKLASLSAIALALALPAGAQAAVLHDQIAPAGVNSVVSENFSPAQDQVDSLAADDFTVPPGQSWTISHVDVIGEDNGGPPPFVNVFLYATDGTLPGAERFRQTSIPASGYPNYSAPVGGAPALGPGTYWIAVQEEGGGFMVPSWAWHTRTVQDGNPAVFQGNNGWMNGCNTFKPLKTCFPSVDGPDLAWKISGAASSLPITSGVLRRLRNGTALLTVNAPGPGSVTLGGTGLKPGSAQVAARKADTSVTLLIKATGKARTKLKKKGKVKVSPTVTYTSPGANPSTATFKVKLVKKRKK